MKADDIKPLRKDRGWSQGELGKRVGVSRQTVWSYENGGAIPQPAWLNLKRVLLQDEEEPGTSTSAHCSISAPQVYQCYLAPIGAAKRLHGTRSFIVEARSPRRARAMAVAYALTLHHQRFDEQRIEAALTLQRLGGAQGEAAA